MKLTELSKAIKEGNERFTKLSKADKRVEIAKDTLVRLDLRQLRAYSGAIVENVSSLPNKYPDIQKTLNSQRDFGCNVCAKGAMFMSYVGRVNSMEFSEIETENQGDTSVHKKLSEIFTLEQLALIETAFEGSQFLTHKRVEDEENSEDSDVIISEEDATKAYVFYASFKTGRWEDSANDDKRLRAICENIIKNKGTFKP